MRWPISEPTLRNDLMASLRVCATSSRDRSSPLRTNSCAVLLLWITRSETQPRIRREGALPAWRCGSSSAAGVCERRGDAVFGGVRELRCMDAAEVSGLGPAVRLRLASGSQWPPNLRRSRIWVAAGNAALAGSAWEEARRCFETALGRQESVEAWGDSHGPLRGSVTRTPPSRRASGRSVRTVPRVTSAAPLGR
jgi:hypothetical protein